MAGPAHFKPRAERKLWEERETADRADQQQVAHQRRTAVGGERSLPSHRLYCWGTEEGAALDLRYAGGRARRHSRGEHADEASE